MQVYVVNPRRKAGQDRERTGANRVEISLALLRQYFDKPLTEVAEELGLSTTAIKKACRCFGINKWPFRALTSYSSRNREAVREFTKKLDEGSWFGPSTTQAATNRPEQAAQGGMVAQSTFDEATTNHDDALETPANPPDNIMEDIENDFTDFDRYSSQCSAPCLATGEKNEAMDWPHHHSIHVPLEPAEYEAPPSPGLYFKKRGSEDNLLEEFGVYEPSPLEAFDSELFLFNTAH
jgi:hypothetical protein